MLQKYPAVRRHHLPLSVPDQGTRRRQPAEAGPGEERRRDRPEAVRRRHDVRHQAAADQGPDRQPGPRAGQGDAPGAASVGDHPGREHPRAAGRERQGLVRERHARDASGQGGLRGCLRNFYAHLRPTTAGCTNGTTFETRLGRLRRTGLPARPPERAFARSCSLAGQFVRGGPAAAGRRALAADEPAAKPARRPRQRPRTNRPNWIR